MLVFCQQQEPKLWKKKAGFGYGFVLASVSGLE